MIAMNILIGRMLNWFGIFLLIVVGFNWFVLGVRDLKVEFICTGVFCGALSFYIASRMEGRYTLGRGLFERLLLGQRRNKDVSDCFEGGGGI
jgi:hypothetical protein